MTGTHLSDDRQCTAHSTRTGERCRQRAIRGGSVCRTHGGSAPQVRQKAQERLLALVEPAIARLSELLAQKRDHKVALGAARDILDRNDLGGKQKIEQSGEVRLTVERVIVDAPRQIGEGE